MNKPIKSTDPRKPAIVAALKEISGHRKVTSVTQVGPDTYEGNCMYGPLPEGRFQVVIPPATGK